MLTIFFFVCVRMDFELICNNAMTYNFPKSLIHIEAKKMRIFGLKAFEFFKDWLSLTEDNFVSPDNPLETLSLDKDKFLTYLDTFYFDILFTNEKEGNNKNVAVIRLNKNQPKEATTGPSANVTTAAKKNMGASFCYSNLSSRVSEKEIVIEISGLNKVLRSIDRRGYVA
jgi:hypothetical protein